MLEVNPIYFILLTEGFLLLLILLLVWVLLSLIGKRRRRKNIAALALRVRNRSRSRGEQNREFLQATYHLDDAELSAAMENIAQHESRFFQHLIEGLGRGGAQLATIDAELDKLVESYTGLQSLRDNNHGEALEAAPDLVALRGENATLREELSAAKNQLTDMVSEFGDMFGGGKDHQFTLHEIVEMVDAMKADQARGQRLKVQK